MNQSNYRNLAVWQKARALAVQVYRTTRKYPRDEMFGLVQQMRRAAISILCNIAEGQGRWTRRDYHRFLIDARGSALELEPSSSFQKTWSSSDMRKQRACSMLPPRWRAC